MPTSDSSPATGEQQTAVRPLRAAAPERIAPGVAELLLPIGSTVDDNPEANAGLNVERWRADLRAVTNPGQFADLEPIVVVARWITTMLEPFVSAQEKVAAEEQMMVLTRRNPNWAATYCAGLLHTVVASLPDDDPWRHLSATVDLDLISFGSARPSGGDTPGRLFSGPKGTTPEQTGALLPGGMLFGTIDSGTDLVQLGPGEDPSRDIALAALVPNLSPLSAAMIGFSSDTGRYFRDMLTSTYQALWRSYLGQSTTRRASELFIHSFSQALRWVAWRRSVYVGRNDPFVQTVAFSWIVKADRVLDGEPIQSHLDLASSGAIEAGAWTEMNENAQAFTGF